MRPQREGVLRGWGVPHGPLLAVSVSRRNLLLLQSRVCGAGLWKLLHSWGGVLPCLHRYMFKKSLLWQKFWIPQKIVFVVSRYRARLTKTTNQHQVIPAFPFVDILSDRVIYYNRADVRALKTVWDNITKAWYYWTVWGRHADRTCAQTQVVICAPRVVKTLGRRTYGDHTTIYQKPVDSSQIWPLLAWLQSIGCMSWTPEVLVLGRCWRYTWNVQASRCCGMLSSFSYGKLLILSAQLTAENKGCSALNLD